MRIIRAAVVLPCLAGCAVPPRAPDAKVEAAIFRVRTYGRFQKQPDRDFPSVGEKRRGPSSPRSPLYWRGPPRRCPAPLLSEDGRPRAAEAFWLPAIPEPLNARWRPNSRATTMKD
jgi:hypothetical protein